MENKNIGASGSKTWFWIATIVIVALIVGGAVYIRQKSKASREKSNLQVQVDALKSNVNANAKASVTANSKPIQKANPVNNTTSGAASLSDFTIYDASDTAGYSFKYPKKWKDIDRFFWNSVAIDYKAKNSLDNVRFEFRADDMVGIDFPGWTKESEKTVTVAGVQGKKIVWGGDSYRTITTSFRKPFKDIYYRDFLVVMEIQYQNASYWDSMNSTYDLILSTVEITDIGEVLGP